MASLGILGGSGNKMARPLDFQAAAGMRGVRGLRGLGGALGASNIPGTCWDAVGFKDCHRAQWLYAQQKCQGGEAARFGGSVPNCIEAYADDLAQGNCVPNYCPQTTTAPHKTGSTGIPVYGSTVNAKVMTFQKLVNKELRAIGYSTIGEDGKLGKGTCGALQLVFYKPELFPNTIKSWGDIGGELQAACGGKPYTMPTRTDKSKPDIVKELTERVAAESTVGPPPWMGAPNAEIARWQSNELNVQLTGHDYLPIPASGQIDAATCGAMQVTDKEGGTSWLSLMGPNCQAFQKPQKKVKIADIVVVPPAPPGPAPGPLPPQPGITGASMATTGLILGALTLGGYWLGKKQGWF